MLRNIQHREMEEEGEGGARGEEKVTEKEGGGGGDNEETEAKL